MAKQKKPGKKKTAQKKATQKKAGTKGNIRPKSTSKKVSPKKTKKAARTKPDVEVKKGALKIEKEGGPRKWFFPLMETAYTKLEPRGESETVRERGRTRGLTPATVTANNVQPESKAVLTPPSQEHWVNVLAEYQQRKVETVSAKAITRGGATRGPFVAGAKNWSPLGPSVVTHGQAKGFPSVGGRVAGIAIAPGGQTVYVASANGGVFRSDDTGMTWKSMMDAFDKDPVNFASTSLACGAIAIDRNDPRRVYVGTGEGNTYYAFQSRITESLPAYRGIGAIRSDDGGKTWILEDTDASSPSLAGKAFFSLAVDPANREHVIAATTQGLYERNLIAGKPQWKQIRKGVHSSIVAATEGSTVYYASHWGVGVVQSKNGTTWTKLTTGFPTGKIGRIEIAVQPNNSNVVYAIVADDEGGLTGIYRYDTTVNSWKKITRPPEVLPNDGKQGDYDLAIAVDPKNADLIYVGGSYFNDGEFWPASIWRCKVTKTSSGFQMSSDPIGASAHSDVHVLVHSPGDPDALWTGTDGGIFLNRNPRSSKNFDSRNSGLACLCTNFFAQHPTDPNILFSGLQDNGTARTSGGPIWQHVNWGDGGYCLINWATPKQVLVFANGSVYRATDGGLDHDSWTVQDFPWSMMTEPIVGPPYNAAQPNDAKTVALGSANRNTGLPQVYVSYDFGITWPDEVLINAKGGIFSLTFATATRFFIGTIKGEVFRADLAAGQWKVNRIDNAAAGQLALNGIVSDIAIDWSDQTGASIYICFGGFGDARHVWHFDGTKWEARSGTLQSKRLLDVEHNAIVVDRAAPANVYAGADIGVWHSADSGATWEPLPNNLPDAPVFDLQIHPTQRLLRASTHGRGLFEWKL